MQSYVEICAKQKVKSDFFRNSSKFSFGKEKNIKKWGV